MIDETSFEQFVRAYQNMVYTTAMRLLGHPDDAKDITQEVFLKAHERFEQLAGNAAAGGWLKRVATNLCLNHLTRYRARWRLFSEMMAADSPVSFEDTLASGRQRSEEEELQHRRHYLEWALRKLPANQRVPLVLYHFEDMPYEEIARQLGVSLSKVKTDIHRGRRSLKQWLFPHFNARKEQEIPRHEAGQQPALECVILPWTLGSEGY